jgi:hypothetical protein
MLVYAFVYDHCTPRFASFRIGPRSSIHTVRTSIERKKSNDCNAASSAYLFEENGISSSKRHCRQSLLARTSAVISQNTYSSQHLAWSIWLKASGE